MDDGALWYPERLSEEFLTQARKTQGSRIFANQYGNEIFPAEDAFFKEEWFRYWSLLPQNTLTYAFIDPAISQEDGADYTGIAVVSVDSDQSWYVRVARRSRLTPTQIITLMFDLYEQFKPEVIGVEKVAFQEALLYMVQEEMQRRGKFIPVSGIHHGTQKTKEMRISGALAPRMEWGFLHFPQGEVSDEVKRELLQFPVAAHDDIIDALASCESIITYPNKPKGVEHDPYNPHHSGYETQVIRDLVAKANESLRDP